MTRRAWSFSLIGALILGATVAALAVRFLNTEDCKTSYDVVCTKNFVRLPGILLSPYVALAVLVMPGAVLGSGIGFAIGRGTDRGDGSRSPQVGQTGRPIHDPPL